MTDYKQDYNDGQIWGWNGGECPVHPETVVKYWTRGGWSDTNKARWIWWNNGDDSSDTIAFQVVKQHVEPKVIWVNEYDGNKLYAYYTEASAKLWTNAPGARIAVKYVEAKDE